MIFSSLLEVDIMTYFGMEKGEDDKTPKIEFPTNLGAKTFVMGHKNVLGKSVIRELFSCNGTLPCDDTPILKRTKNYVEAISALVLKLERRFIHTHQMTHKYRGSITSRKRGKSETH